MKGIHHGKGPKREQQPRVAITVKLVWWTDMTFKLVARNSAYWYTTIWQTVILSRKLSCWLLQKFPLKCGYQPCKLFHLFASQNSLFLPKCSSSFSRCQQSPTDFGSSSLWHSFGLLIQVFVLIRGYCANTLSSWPMIMIRLVAFFDATHMLAVGFSSKCGIWCPLLLIMSKYLCPTNLTLTFFTSHSCTHWHLYQKVFQASFWKANKFHFMVSRKFPTRQKSTSNKIKLLKLRCSSVPWHMRKISGRVQPHQPLSI